MPGNRTRRIEELTPEQIAEMQAEFADLPRLRPARLPQAPLAANTPWRVDIGDAALLDELGDRDVDPSKIRIDRLTRPDAPQLDMGVTPAPVGAPAEPTDWLQELINNPPQTPSRPLSGRAPGGATFDGEDTPESRELMKSRGMTITSTPTDNDLLAAAASDRPTTMPEIETGSLDDLIAAESADMDDEARAAAAQRYAQAFGPRPMSREQALGDVGQGPSRVQGIAALLQDTFFPGGGALDKLAARSQKAREAVASARMEDIAAGERAEDREATRGLTREMTLARLGTTQRGQDMRASQQQASLEQRKERGEQVDERIRSEGQAGRDAAMQRTELLARGGQPAQTPEQQATSAAAWLSQQANVSLPKARAYVAGNRQGLSDEEIERLDANYDQWQGASPKAQGRLIEKGLAREGATPDQTAAALDKKRGDPKERAKLRTELADAKASVTNAINGWQSLSPNARKVLVSVGNAQDPDSFLNAIRNASLTGAEQAAASDAWKLINELMKARSGAAVTNPEMLRLADEAGLPAGGWTSLFKSPQVMHQWLGRIREAAIRRRKIVEDEYGSMSGGGP